MHILLVADSDEKYGASQSMKQLADRLLKYDKDMQISVVLPLRNHSEEYYQRLGCPTYKILYEPFCQNILEQKWKRPLKFLVRGAEYLFGKYFGVYCLSRRLDMDSIDLIHSNSSREDFSAALALKYKKPLVWHIRELGEHCFSFRKDYISLMNQAATQFIAVSETVKERWIKKGLQEEKIVRIYNGVDSKVSRNPVLAHLNVWMSSRFACANRVWALYGVSFLGQKIYVSEEERKLAGITEKLWLDNAYMSILLRHGIVTFLLFSIGYVWLMKYAAAQKKYMLLTVLFLFAVYGIMETGMYAIGQNLFLLFFADLIYRKGDGGCYEKNHL